MDSKIRLISPQQDKFLINNFQIQNILFFFIEISFDMLADQISFRNLFIFILLVI